MKFEHYCLAVLTLCAAFAIGFVGYEGGFLLRDLRFKTLPLIDQNAKIVGGAATNIEKGTRPWMDSQKQLTDQARAATSQLNSDLLTLGTLLSTANATLETQGESLKSLQGQASGLLSHTDAQIADLSHAIQPIASNLQETTQNAASATAALNSTILRIAPDLESTSKSTAQTSANVADTTADVKTFVHRETQPIRGTWHVIKSFLFEIAGPAASVATSIK